MMRLIIEDDEGGTSTVAMDRPEVSIGRTDENVLHLPERNVSRKHARLLHDNDAYFIEDLDSYNGVRVNGERITRRVRVTQQDLIEIGDYRIVIRVDGDASGEPETLPPTSEDTPPAFQVVNGPSRAAPEAPPQAPPNLPEAASSIPPPPVPSAAALAPAAPETQPPPPVPEPEAYIPTTPPAVAQSAAETPARSEVSRTDISTADTAVIRISGAAREKLQEPEAPDTSAVITTGPPGKLVCLAAPFEGKSFTLDRAEMVLGRNRDSDVFLDHRSVEDRHAKVIYQHGTYSVVDLGSADGLKVNDEPYRMISLRRGDILTVGHMRFRFVAPGEEFTFVPGIEEAERFADTAAARRLGLPVVLGLGAGILILLVVVAVFLFGGDDTDTPKPPTPAPTLPTVGPKPTPPEPTVPTKTSLAADVGAALDRGKNALQAENWTLAMASFKSALEKDPASQEARTLLDQAAAEQGFSARYEECSKLFAAQDYARAFESCKGIAETSRYSSKAKKLMPKIRSGFVNKHLAAAKQAVRKGEWNKAKEETDQIFIFDPENVTAKELLQKIADRRKKGTGTRTARTGRTKPPKPPKPPPTKRTSRPRPAKANTREQAKKLYVEATKYHQANKLERAIEMYRKAVKTDPSFAYAYRGLGIAYASLGNGKAACRMYRKYLKVAPSAPDRGQVQTILQECRD